MTLREIMLVQRVSYDFASSGMGLREFPRYRELHGELGAVFAKLSAYLELYSSFLQFEVSLRINRKKYVSRKHTSCIFERIKKKKKNEKRKKLQF